MDASCGIAEHGKGGEAIDQTAEGCARVAPWRHFFDEVGSASGGLANKNHTKTRKEVILQQKKGVRNQFGATKPEPVWVCRRRKNWLLPRGDCFESLETGAFLP